MLRPFSCSGVNVALLPLTSMLCVAPSASTYVRVAPSGILPISTETDSEPSASVDTAEISSAIAESSVPDAALIVTSAASATAATSIEIEPDVVAVAPPSLSVDVAVTCKSIVPPKSSAGVIVRLSNKSGSFAKSSAEIVHVPSPLLVPADNSAPSGTPEIVIDSDSEPSVSVNVALISNAIGPPSSAPNAKPSPRSSVGTSALASTSTKSCSPFTLSVKSSSEFGAGVMVKPLRSATVNVYEPLPLNVPAESSAPSGTPVIVISVALPGSIFKVIGWSSIPVAFSISMTPSTSISNELTATPPSVEIAVT